MVTLSGVERDGLAHAFAPVLVGLAHHAGDQVDIDLRKSDGAREPVGRLDLLRRVGAPVGLEDLVVEVLDAQAEAGDAQICGSPAACPR